MNQSEARAPAFLSFDPIAQDYDWTRYIPPEAQTRAAEILCAVTGIAPGQIWLDAGVGTGRFALPMARTGVRVVGVDISANMLAQLEAKRASESAQAQANLRLLRGDLRYLPLANASAQAALLVHILHLISDWKAVLEEIRRVLVPGGVLITAGEGGRNVPTRTQYLQWAEEMGILRPQIGADHEVFHAYLRENGATVDRVDGDRVQWAMDWPVTRTLDMLRRRTWSSLWEVSDSIHEELLQRTEAWARETYGTLDAVETVETTLKMDAVRWSNG